MSIIGKGLDTHFAAPERGDLESVKKISEELRNEFLLPWFDAIPACVMVLNMHRQIVYCNDAFKKLSLKQHIEDVIGKRPGEALDCVNAALMEAGCGCSLDCRSCGAARAIVKSLQGEEDCQNCRMTRVVDHNEVPLDLQVFTRPTTFRDESFIFLFALDISHELRLRYLNRTFYHGLINTVGSITSLAELIEAEPEDVTLFPMLLNTSRRILRDVMYHRDLHAAEQGGMVSEKQNITPMSFISDLVNEECRIRNVQPSMVDYDIICGTLFTDPKILRHVLRNLFVNALEAREVAGGRISIHCRRSGDGTMTLSMTNDGDVPVEIQGQIFGRYVSTKSPDRGLGTYVAKLFTEKYLGGSIACSTGDGKTTFTIFLS